MFATTPEPPYYAVIFTSTRRAGDEEAYVQTAQRMFELAHRQPGFLGVEFAQGPVGITVSYWKDEASIAAWRRQAEHMEAQRRGRDDWYAGFRIRVARVERDSAFAAPAAAAANAEA